MNFFQSSQNFRGLTTLEEKKFFGSREVCVKFKQSHELAFKTEVTSTQSGPEVFTLD